MSDTYVPLATTAAGRYSERFLRAIDHALAVRPEQRPQSVQALASELGIAIESPDDTDQPNETTPRASVEATGTRARTVAATTVAPKRDESDTTAVPTEGGGNQRKRTGLIAAAAVCVVALAAIGAWLATRTPPAASTAVTASTQAPGTASPKPADNAAPAPGNAAQSPAAVAPVVPVAPASPAMATAPATSPASANILAAYTPASELERIVTLADPSIHVTATPRSTTATIGKDHLQFKLDSNRAGYVYLFMVDPDGQYLLLFPNGLDRNNRIAAGQTLSLPRASWPMMAGNPPGPNHFLTLVSTTPRDFSDGGLKPMAPFQSFPADAQQKAAARRSPSYSPFVGKPRCPAGTADCAGAFGAATFTIDAVKPPG
jgi:hypothetical protein